LLSFLPAYLRFWTNNPPVLENRPRSSRNLLFTLGLNGNPSKDNILVPVKYATVYLEENVHLIFYSKAKIAFLKEKTLQKKSLFFLDCV